MSCDMCGAKCAPYQMVALLSSYKTKDIEWICPSCEKETNDHLAKLKHISHGWCSRMLKVWMRNKKTRKYTKEAQRDE